MYYDESEYPNCKHDIAQLCKSLQNSGIAKSAIQNSQIHTEMGLRLTLKGTVSKYFRLVNDYVSNEDKFFNSIFIIGADINTIHIQL